MWYKKSIKTHILKLHKKSLLLSVLFFLIALGVTLIQTYISYENSHNILEQTVKRELINKGNLISLSLDFKGLKQITSDVTNTEDNSKEYQSIIQPLIHAHKKVNDIKNSIKYVYTTHKIGDQIHFGLDTAPRVDADNDGKLDHAFLNEKYDTPPEELLNAFNTGEVQITQNPYSDSWGTFIGAFIPLKDDSGNVFSVLGLDLTLDQYLADLNLLQKWVKINIIITVSLLFIFSCILYFFLERSNELKLQFLKQKDQELLLIQQEKLAEVGLISSSVAHEINNPLNVIYLHLLSMKRKIDDKEKILNSISKIEEAYDKIQKTLISMKNFIRMDDATKKIIPINEVVLNTMEFLKVKTKYYDISLNLKVNPTISCFETQISQVLINLISNAMDAQENDKVKKIFIENELENNKVVIKVKNSGDLIPSEILKKIETGFFSTKDKGKGSGMGLMISKKILENHDGKLLYKVEDNMNCFYLEIPLDVSQTEVA